MQACGARIVTSDTGTISVHESVQVLRNWDYDSNCTWYIIAEKPGNCLIFNTVYMFM